MEFLLDFLLYLYMFLTLILSYYLTCPFNYFLVCPKIKEKKKKRKLNIDLAVLPSYDITY